MIDYTRSPGVPCAKPNHPRSGKLTQKQMGAITPKVRDEVKSRSGGYCEVRIKCQGALGVHMAHLTGRNVIKRRTTAKDLKFACNACHTHIDTTGEGVREKKMMREKDAG